MSQTPDLLEQLRSERQRRLGLQRDFRRHFTACPCQGDPNCPQCIGTGKITKATAKQLEQEAQAA